FGGTNAHVIIEEANSLVVEQDQLNKPYYLIALSSKQPSGLQQKISVLAAWLPDHPAINLENLSYTLNAGRAHFPYRCALIVASIEELITTLSDVILGNVPKNYFLYRLISSKRWFDLQ